MFEAEPQLESERARAHNDGKAGWKSRPRKSRAAGAGVKCGFLFHSGGGGRDGKFRWMLQSCKILLARE